MTLCRAYDNLDLFITFTSNPKWPEIAEMLAYFPQQKAHDRPEVGTHVFKLRLTELLDDLTKKYVFGQSEAVVYVIEFQKRGLPHAHILLWLEEHSKCRTPSELDDIISTELPSPTDDPAGYKVVTEYMLHGPCGKEARYAACTNDGKCSKHFPKPFLAKTFLDEEGYPHYRRRDNKLSFHLPNQNVITLRDSENLPALLQREVRGVTGFEHLMTVNHRLYATFKEVCFAYGFLNDDMEWTKALSEASLWALGPQLRDIFITMLVFCDVAKPLKLWETNQILPVIPKAKIPEIVQACINRSKLWNYCKVLAVGDGTLPAKMKEGEDEPTWIDIPEKFLIKSWDSLIQQIVTETYPDFTSRQTDDEYLKERAILTPRNDDAEVINKFMFKQLSGEPVTYYRADEICKASTDIIDHH
ncbi:ATP-dependent DNA helicase PIF1-like protein [Tanacetum coccineum]